MNIYFQYALYICGIAALGGVAFSQFRKGARGESGDIIKFYKEQAENYKNMLDATRTEYVTKHEVLIKEVGELRGQVIAERQLREQYEAILKDRNPETKSFMEYMVQATKDQAESHKEIVRVLGEIHAMAKAEYDRDLQITSTVTKS